MGTKSRTYQEIAEDLVRTRIRHGLLKLKREAAIQRAIELQHRNLIERWGPDDGVLSSKVRLPIKTDMGKPTARSARLT